MLAISFLCQPTFLAHGCWFYCRQCLWWVLAVVKLWSRKLKYIAVITTQWHFSSFFQRNIFQCHVLWWDCQPYSTVGSMCNRRDFLNSGSQKSSETLRAATFYSSAQKNQYLPTSPIPHRTPVRYYSQYLHTSPIPRGTPVRYDLQYLPTRPNTSQNTCQVLLAVPSYQAQYLIEHLSGITRNTFLPSSYQPNTAQNTCQAWLTVPVLQPKGQRSKPQRSRS